LWWHGEGVPGALPLLSLDQLVRFPCGAFFF
jgi:hypothetical protein